MDIYNEIMKCKSDDELRAFADFLCDRLTMEKEDCKCNTIGSVIGYNPLDVDLKCDNSFGNEFYRFLNCWVGYIPVGTKIVYGSCFHDNYKYFSNEGCYYFIDDNSFVYEFFKYIKKYSIMEEYDIVLAIFHFIENNYISYLDHLQREDVHKMILRPDGFYYDRIKEHSINDFNKEKCSQCTEVSFYTQNLLSIFGIESLYIMDTDHAYNICQLSDFEDSNKKSYYVLDCSDWVFCYDYKHNLIDKMPFIKKIDGCDDEFLQNFIDGKFALNYNDYYLYEIDGVGYKFDTRKRRKYAAGIDIQKKQNQKKLI